MNVWFDLIANTNNKLGILDGNGNNTITPEIAEHVVKHIAKKYHPEVIPTLCSP
jgi:hypothetical protein